MNIGHLDVTARATNEGCMALPARMSLLRLYMLIFFILRIGLSACVSAHSAVHCQRSLSGLCSLRLCFTQLSTTLFKWFSRRA
jgi:hypothetical protein